MNILDNTEVGAVTGDCTAWNTFTILLDNDVACPRGLDWYDIRNAYRNYEIIIGDNTCAIVYTDEDNCEKEYSTYEELDEAYVDLSQIKLDNHRLIACQGVRDDGTLWDMRWPGVE